MFTVIPNYSDVPRTQVPINDLSFNPSEVRMSVSTSDEKLSKDEDKFKYEEEDKFKYENAYKDEYKDEEEERDVRLEVEVGKWFLNITVDGKKVIQKTMNHSDVGRMRKGGLYLTVLHPSTFVVMHTSRHRTFEMSGDMELLRVLNGVQPGRIVVLAAMNEGFQQLSDLTVSWLFNIGSLAIPDMTTGDSECVEWPKGGVWTARRRFCDRYEGYWDLCSCTNPEVLPSVPPHSPLTTSSSSSSSQLPHEGQPHSLVQSLSPHYSLTKSVGVIPTVVVASQRPLCLYWCLRRLMGVVGSDPRLTLVVADGDPEGGLREVRELVNLFGIKYVDHDSGGRDVTKRITRHYRFVLDTVFITFPTAPAAIILEEDLYVAGDFYRYFSQTAPLLLNDPSLYCVSAWNDLSRRNSRGDPAVVMRSQTMAGLGWMLSREVYQEVIQKWPAWDKDKSSENVVAVSVEDMLGEDGVAVSVEDMLGEDGVAVSVVDKVGENGIAFADWDMWLRLPELQRGRECLVPEVSRTFHFGSTGAHLTAHFHAKYYSQASFNVHPDVDLKGLDVLGPESYDVYLRGLVTRAAHMDGAKANPCSTSFLPRNSTTTHLLWFKMNHDHDDYTYMGIMSCLGLWNLDVRGHHRLLWRLRWKGTPLLMIAYPASPFSTLKKKEVNVMQRYNPNKSSASTTP
ncbi:hypothetical protein Pcinc_019260 [Petrolisthes cinctipes]|uniref:Alpha-1,3-mannosyl-glycoprotein 2-beta-N-acetylglucosaminyltransferase n=1 Tax=Petrolisthes cinctipes TaxID=88211 RepID=A0AAE1FQC4_PETCI|nr:hypothetical protein Pcinc_019260 [Petrolisthes cinctipes]